MACSFGMTSTPEVATELESQESASDGSKPFSPEFIQCLEGEAELLKSAIVDGSSPMVAHAKTMVWLDALVKMHAIGLEQSIETNDSTQTAIWSRDLGTLELAMALIQSVKPLEA